MRRSKPVNKGPVKKDDGIQLNEMIKADKVRLVGEGREPEILSLQDALAKAEEEGLDLVQVSVSQDIPVVKIVDFGKYRFDFLKKQKEARKKQKVITVKEVKLRPKIDTHDFDTKKKKAISFIEKGDKVKVTMMFRGREMAHKELGFDVIGKLREEIQDLCQIEKEPSMEGPNIVMVLAPKKK